MSTKPKVPRTVVDKTEDNKLYLSYEYLHELVKVCADAMKNRDFKADAIVAIGAGGFFPGRILRTYTGTPILAVSIQLYDDTTNKPKDKPEKTQWISEGQVEQYIRGKNIIVIDEVDDTRTTLAYCCKELIDLHQPKAVSAMVLINKKKEKRGVFPKEVTYFAGADIEDIWCKFPWDALDIRDHQKKAHAQRSALPPLSSSLQSTAVITAQSLKSTDTTDAADAAIDDADDFKATERRKRSDSEGGSGIVI